MKILLTETVPNSPVSMQNFASHSQETVKVNTGTFPSKMLPSIFTILNDFVFVMEVMKPYFTFSCISKHL